MSEVQQSSGPQPAGKVRLLKAGPDAVWGKPKHSDNYDSKVKLQAPGKHPLGEVGLYWYPNGTVRIQIKRGAPSVITGAYMEGPEGDTVQIKVKKV